MNETSSAAGLPRQASAASRIYLRPLGLQAGAALDWQALELIVREDETRLTRAVLDDTGLRAWAADQAPDVAMQLEARLKALRAPRARLAGHVLDRPLVMGVVNVTPDSFSDGGDHADPTVAIAAGRRMSSAGAHIIDVGGESTRPRAQQPEAATELARVMPVIEALTGDGLTVSIDTRRAGVMREAVASGASIINDVSALTGDGESLAVAASLGAPVILMHMQGTPEMMQDNPAYDAAPFDVFDWLEIRVAECVAGGVAPDRIAVDPGIGFGKTLEHNLEILRDLAVFHGLGCPLAIGVSRKAFIGRLSDEPEPKRRLAGSLSAMLHAVDQGAHIVRVHDVAETVQALAVRASLERPRA